jgi:hypothetical protein
LAAQQFLEGNFKIINRVGNLPQPVLQVFTEEGGSRFVMADPGKEFQATDVIYDGTLPRKRLILAGVQDDRCFVLYEQGGIGLSEILAFFKLTSKDSMEPLWSGYCWTTEINSAETEGGRSFAELACRLVLDYSRVVHGSVLRTIDVWRAVFH